MSVASHHKWEAILVKACDRYDTAAHLILDLRVLYHLHSELGCSSPLRFLLLKACCLALHICEGTSYVCDQVAWLIHAKYHMARSVFLNYGDVPAL